MTVGTQWQFIMCLGHWRDRIALKLFRKIIHQWNESSHERQSGVLTAMAWLVPHETAAVSARSVYTIQPCHFMQNHIRKVHVCLAVTCHLHFWQNDRDLLPATVVTRGWNICQNKSQHRRLTLEKKMKILPPLLQVFEPVTLQSRVRRSNHWAIPLPMTNTSQKMSLTRLLWRFIRILFALVTFFNRNNSTIQQR